MSGHPDRRLRRRVMYAVRFLFSPRGRISRTTYALTASCALAVVYMLWTAARTGAEYPGELAPAVVMVAMLVLRFWVLPALTLRRAADAGVPGWMALLAVVPIADIVLVAALSVVRGKDEPADADTGSSAEDLPLSFRAAVMSVGVGVMLAVGAVAFGALVMGRYGTGLFVYTPFMVGVTTAYLANAGGDVGLRRTLQVQLVLGVAAAVSFIAVALEGFVCIIMAAPLALPLMLIGATFGRAMAMRLQRAFTHAVAAPALLVTLLVLEQLSPTQGTFTSTHSIRIDAPPAAVWRAVTRMEPMRKTPTLPFLLGVAYPTGGELLGRHAGALRHGHFSTGTAVERVTSYEPQRELAFEVLSEPPSMVELSFYDTVHAPHVQGYFRTLRGTFRLTELPAATTRLWEQTEHALDLEPLAYWLPMARWMVEQNNARVLRHISRQAEAAAGHSLLLQPASQRADQPREHAAKQ